jgi:hypothetical protein
MPCVKCAKTPGYHSFEKFGNLGEETLYYTAPAKTLDFNEDGTKLANLLIDIEEKTSNKPWGWVVDCSNMGFHHYTDLSFNMGILHLLNTNPNIGTLWVFRPNIWIRGTIALLNQFTSSNVLEKIQYFEGSNLELFQSLREKGLDGEQARWLIRQ